MKRQHEAMIKAIGSTFQIVSGEIQQGVDNGYPVDVQVKLTKALTKTLVT